MKCPREPGDEATQGLNLVLFQIVLKFSGSKLTFSAQCKNNKNYFGVHQIIPLGLISKFGLAKLLKHIPTQNQIHNLPVK